MSDGAIEAELFGWAERSPLATLVASRHGSDSGRISTAKYRQQQGCQLASGRLRLWSACAAQMVHQFRSIRADFYRGARQQLLSD